MEPPAHGDFESFYVSSKDRVYQALLVSGRRADRAEDAVAEAFARAFAKWDKVKAMDHPIAWLVRVAFNAYNADWRIWRRESHEVPEVLALSDEHPIDATILAALWQLPKRQRQVIALRIVLDLSIHETANLLHIAPKTVTVHQYRAIQSLRMALEKGQKDGEAWTTTNSLTR